MDSREQPQPQLPNMMVAPTFYPSMLAPATARFPYSSNSNSNINININSNNSNPHPPPPPPPPASEPLNSDTANNNNNSTFEALKPCPLAASESAKKKRGRPRKYSPDGNIALGLGTTHASASSADPPAKKHRGRPPGSGKKQMDALGIPGTGFTPHVITVDAGEDIAAKLVAFCEQGRRTVCTLSASGAIRNVTIRAPGMPAGILAFEGQFEIISLKAATLQSDNRMAALSVTIAGPDGQLLGGEVVGALTAATAVQVVLGSFIADGKKSSSSNLKSGHSSTPSSQMLAFGASPTPTPSPSEGPSTDSSEHNENSHFNKGPGGSGLYNNNAIQQPIHTMPMYQHQLWAAHTQQ